MNHADHADTMPLIPLEAVLEPALHTDMLPGLEWL